MKFRPELFTAQNYLATTFLYGLSRKGIEMQKATITHYDRETRQEFKIPVLLSDKLAVTVFAGINATCMWPYYLYKDFVKLEVKQKRLNPSWYGIEEKKYLSDYIYS